MATYVNDLRLKEIGTGESSGTWGSETNVNLELIGEALGFGTEGITTNADTHTTTVADGSTDPGRAMYLKYTGTLDSACTITIAPNTISRMQFIENGTSGSQNIIISQGTGANITIPPGDTKAVYLDGAGSGAAVVDAFASLSTVDLKVQDDLTVTDDASVGGDLLVSGEVQTANIGFTDGDNAITISDGGGTSFAQKITADAGIDIDNITIDGTEIDLSSGDLTLDVEGDIILDANGGDIQFSDNGTNIGNFTNSSSDFVIEAKVQDKDIIFKGDDNGSGITALTLDMSDAGRALFNEGIRLSGLNGGTGLAFDLAGSTDYTIKESSTNDVFSFGGQIHHNISSGRVGIGTTSPGQTLSVNASGGANFFVSRTDQTGGLYIESDGTNGIIRNPASNPILLQTNGANTRASVTNDGITFNGDTAAANALDDYEEGTFDPGATISGATGAITYNATNNHLVYTKIGDMVHIQGTLQIASNSSGGGRLNITNLPFTAEDGDGLGGQTIFHVQISGGTGSQASGYLASLAEGATQIQVQTYTGVSASNNSVVTMAVDSFLLIGGQYKAA